MMSDSSRYCFLIFFSSHLKKNLFFSILEETTRIKRSVIRYFSRGIGYEHFCDWQNAKNSIRHSTIFFCIKISAKVFSCFLEFLIIYQISPHIPWFADLEFLLSNWKRHCLNYLAAAVMELVWTCLMRILNVMIVAQVISSQNL